MQSGRQVNRGVELTATGNVTEGLRLLGGVTWLDAKVTNNQSNTAMNGKQPLYTTPLMIKATAEYDLPFPFSKGFTLTGGVYYNGKQPADAINSEFLPSYVTEDLGLRYRTNLPTGEQVIVRLNISNITNRSYWLDPNLTGAPRTIAMSTEIKF